MAYVRPPSGITPPAPGLEREEPVFVPEEDIPTESYGDIEQIDQAPQHSVEVE